MPKRADRRVGGRLSRAQGVVVGYVPVVNGQITVPAKVQRTVGRAVLSYIAVCVENSLFCRDERCYRQGLFSIAAPQAARQAVAAQGISPAQGVGQPAPTDHISYEVSGVSVGHPAAVTYSGRAEGPRRTAMAWAVVRRGALAMPITGTPNCSRARVPSPGRGHDRLVPGVLGAAGVPGSSVRVTGRLAGRPVRGGRRDLCAETQTAPEPRSAGVGDGR